MSDPTSAADLSREESDNLKKRALSALSAYRCCKNGERRAESQFRSLLGAVTQQLLLAESPDPRKLIALAPGVAFPGVLEIPSATWTVAQVSPRLSLAGPAAVGAILLVAESTLGSIRERTAALELASGLLNAIGVKTQTKKKTDECLSCVLKSVWKQTNPMSKVSKKPHRTRQKAAPKRPGAPSRGEVKKRSTAP